MAIWIGSTRALLRSVYGWTITGSARSDGFRLKVPDSRSEEDYRIDMGWIVGSAGSGRVRLLEVTRTALTSLQRAISESTHTSWPDGAEAGGPNEPHAETGGDDVNPTMRLWYGPEHAPVLELRPPIPLNQVLTG